MRVRQLSRPNFVLFALHTIFFLTSCRFQNKLEGENTKIIVEEPEVSVGKANEKQDTQGYICVDERLNTVPTYVQVETFSKIKQIIDGTTKCYYNYETHSWKGCELIEIGFKPRDGNPESRGSRILMLDSGLKFLAFASHRKRVLDFIEQDEKGRFATTKNSLSLPLALNKIFDLLAEHKKFPSAGELSTIYAANPKILAIHKKMQEKFVGLSNLAYVHHGTSLASALIEYNPNTEFVFGEHDYNMGIKNELCTGYGNDDSLVTIRDYYETAAKSLEKIIRDNKINYINFSFGDSVPELRRYAARECGERQPSDRHLLDILKIKLDEFYRPLASIPGVLMVQSASNDVDLNDADTENYMVDCANLPNRIRIGYFKSVDDTLPVWGAKEVEEQSIFFQSGRACVDLFIKLGFSGGFPSKMTFSRYPPLEVDIDGLSLGGEFIGCMGTSLAAPLALSYIIYLKSLLRQQQLSVSELIQVAREKGQGVYKDPGLHGEFEIYRRKRMQVDGGCFDQRNLALKTGCIGERDFAHSEASDEVPVCDFENKHIGWMACERFF